MIPPPTRYLPTESSSQYLIKPVSSVGREKTRQKRYKAKGHDFSRADNADQICWALQATEKLIERGKMRQGMNLVVPLKPIELVLGLSPCGLLTLNPHKSRAFPQPA